jgi:hypothetical protein
LFLLFLKNSNISQQLPQANQNMLELEENQRSIHQPLLHFDKNYFTRTRCYHSFNDFNV